MAKKKLSSDDYWAQQIIRAQQGGKDYIFALVRRKYDEDETAPQVSNSCYISVDAPGEAQILGSGNLGEIIQNEECK